MQQVCVADASTQLQQNEEGTQLVALTHKRPMHAVLERLGTKKHVLVVRVHHSLSDGFSSTVLRNELQSAYHAVPINFAATSKS